MIREIKRKITFEEGAAMFDWFLWQTKLQTFKTPSGNEVLWIPWKGWVIPLNDFKAVNHAVVMIGGCEPRRSMRKVFVQGFIDQGIDSATASTYAPQEFITAAKTKNLF